VTTPKIERPTHQSVTAVASQINRSEPKAHDREDIRENTVDDTDDDKDSDVNDDSKTSIGGGGGSGGGFLGRVLALRRKSLTSR